MMNMMMAHKNEEVDLEKYWRIEATGTEKMNTVSMETTEYQKQYEKTSIRKDGDKYFTKLLWKEEHDALPLNRTIAYRRTENVVKRLKKEPDMLATYGEIIKELY